MAMMYESCVSKRLEQKITQHCTERLFSTFKKSLSIYGQFYEASELLPRFSFVKMYEY